MSRTVSYNEPCLLNLGYCISAPDSMGTTSSLQILAKASYTSCKVMPRLYLSFLITPKPAFLQWIDLKHFISDSTTRVLLRYEPKFIHIKISPTMSFSNSMKHHGNEHVERSTCFIVVHSRYYFFFRITYTFVSKSHTHDF